MLVSSAIPFYLTWGSGRARIWLSVGPDVALKICHCILDVPTPCISGWCSHCRLSCRCGCRLQWVAAPWKARRKQQATHHARSHYTPLAHSLHPCLPRWSQRRRHVGMVPPVACGLAQCRFAVTTARKAPPPLLVASRRASSVSRRCRCCWRPRTPSSPSDLVPMSHRHSVRNPSRLAHTPARLHGLHPPASRS